ncbi:MAG: efflux RND transporter permease subunit [Candidatus Riflebacteria bacterium]|nr:efflux RND transporter permease subunit [Candidatus Riflebacteria bacterium]
MLSFMQFLVRQRWFVLIVTAATAALGWTAWNALPIDAFPDVTNVQVMILTKAGGQSAPDVEQRITFPIEQRLSGLPGVTQIRSLSKAGLSQVVVVFEDSTDVYFARQLVFERLSEAREALPAGVMPEMTPISTGLGEVFQYTIDGEGISPRERRTLQDWVVAPMLRAIPGVTEVNSFGGEVKQYQVMVDPERLQKYGLTLREVLAALENDNANAGGGYIVKGWEQSWIRSIGLFKDVTEIGGVVLRAKNGTPVLVRDVAEIIEGAEPRQGAVTRDGKGETTAGMVIMLKGANSKTVVEKVKETLPEIRRTLPKGAELNVFYDRTYLIQACIETVMNAMKEGGICVTVVLFLFLAELRTALIVVLSLPLTFLASFFVMRLVGESSNLMSLGGLAFSVGMVVDATIVVVENARRRLAEAKSGENHSAVIARATAEVAKPVTFSVFIIVLVLIPLFSLQGMEAKMFGPLALTMLIALLASLGTAFFAMPAISRLMLPVGKEYEFFFVRWLHRLYATCLLFAMRFSPIVLCVAIASLIGAASLIPGIGTEFMPTLREGAIAINVVRLPNASLEGSVRVSTEIERRLTDLPEVSSVICKTGRAEISEDPMGPEQTDVFITLRDRHELPGGRSQDDMTEVVKERLDQIPGIRCSYSQPISLRVNELISGIKSDVAVKIFGPDLDILSTFAGKVAAVVGGIPGANDTRSAQMAEMDQIDVEIDRAAASRYGIGISQVNELIETAVGGRVVTVMSEGQRRFAVVVRYAAASRSGEAAIEGLRIVTGDGALISLGQIVKVRRVSSPAEITRERGMRRAVVETNVRGRDLGGFVTEARQKLESVTAELPSGYFVEYGGQFENQERAMARLTLVVPVVLGLILVLLVMTLGTLRDALLVVLNLPFAVIGGIVAVRIFKLSLSVSAAVAFIVLLGIAVQNGVLLVAFFRDGLHRGLSVNAAVRSACRTRFRPLMMTALTSFIGHLPMLYATGSGAEIQKPLAVVVMGGLITSTMLTLLVLPPAFRWVESRVVKRRRLHHNKQILPKPDRSLV